MSFQQLEESNDSSEPRECVWVRHGLVQHRIAFTQKDIMVGGALYTATPGKRSEAGVASAGKLHEMSFTLDIEHPFSQRYLWMGLPPMDMHVIFYRQQHASGDFEMFWDGYIVSSQIEETLLTFIVHSQLDIALQKKLSGYRVGRICNHELYGPDCTVNRLAFSVTSTVTMIKDGGYTVIVADVGGKPNGYFQYGPFSQGSTLETRSISNHIGNTFTLQVPIPGLVVGDSVTFSAGCMKIVQTCSSKFSNQVNFGSFPDLPTTNPHIPDGLGVWVSE